MKDIMKGVAVKVISIIVIAALAIGGGCLTIKHYINKARDIVQDEKNMSIEDILKERLETTAELNTADYICTYVEEYSDSKIFNGWKIPLTTKSFMISYEGTVKAGIKDLRKARIIEKADNTVVVELPEVEITGHEIHKDTLKVYDESRNIFNPTSVVDVNEAQKDLEKEMVERAKKYGLLDQARENSKKVITSMLQSTNGEYSVVIEWQ